jgi:predicted AlkP superfamily pyrophosphatase or phosphodiesterase
MRGRVHYRLLPRLRRIAGASGIALLALGMSAAAPAPSQTEAGPALSQPAARGAVTDHVIVISIDGLRPDAIGAFEAHVMQRMLREGAYSLTAETVYPSKTLPSHTSMLTGVPPAVHGVTWNTDRTATHGKVEPPTIFALAKAAGFSTAAFFSKPKLRHLQQPGSLDHAQAPVGLGSFSAAQTVEDATRYMRFRRPNLMFVHIAEPDAAGHSFGWMGQAYRMAVRRADAAVGRIIAAADATYGAGQYTVIVTADHGGHERGHGSDHEDDMQIPWIAWGAGVERGALVQPINTMDTAATVLWLLGVAEPPVWQGVAVAAAYTPAARLLAGRD